MATTWYAIFNPVSAPAIYRSLLEIVKDAERIEASGVLGAEGIRILARAQKLVKDYMDGLDEAAKIAAIAAETEIHAWLKRTQAAPRPAARGELERSIEAKPLGAISGLPSGRVGIGNIELMNRLTTRSGARPGRDHYWEVQELGFIPRGKQLKGIIGFFMPGRVVPSPPGRTEPEFQVMRGGKRMRPKPYGPRFFMRNGTNEALKVYKAELKKLERQILLEARALLGAP